MSKVKSIRVSNLKAISQQQADFNGCTAIITGGNNKGKTTFLRSIFDRCRGVKPEVIIKEGQESGFAEAELTTGEKLKWEFSKGEKGLKEKLTYITEKDVKTSLTSELREKFLPGIFDVDKFLQDQPAKQKKTLQQLVGIDFTDIDQRYKAAYEDRESKNRAAKEEAIKFEALPNVKEVQPVDLSDLVLKKETERARLNELYLKNKAHNESLRNEWVKQCDAEREKVTLFNNEQSEKRVKYNACYNAVKTLESFGIDVSVVNVQVKTIAESIQDSMPYTEPDQPEYIDEMPDDSKLREIETQMVAAAETNQRALEYNSYILQKQKYEDAKRSAKEADDAVKSIEAERMELIKSAKMPEGFGFSDDGITYNNLPFTREQLSSSGIYIAALKLAAMTLGEIKTLHFDASFLDKNSLSEIEKWATSEDLQLLIERPDFEGGDIKYELICE